MIEVCRKCGARSPADGTYCEGCAIEIEAKLGTINRAYVRGDIRLADAQRLREAYVLVWAWEAKQYMGTVSIAEGRTCLPGALSSAAQD